MTVDTPFVIVGASLAGAKAAEKVTEPIQGLIRDRVPVDDRRLADPDVRLEDLAGDQQASTP